MPASLVEQSNAQNNGVLIKHWSKPSKLMIESDQVIGVEFEYTEIKDQKLVSKGEKYSIPADIVFRAIGQSFDAQNIDGFPQISNGKISVNEDRKTSINGIWAGGDCIIGGEDLTVSAVEDGKRAAISIHKDLSKK